MATSRSAWKKREAQAAAIFGARRQPCSGSSGRSDITRSDSTHPVLFIETKLRAKHAARELWEDTREKAAKEGKVPVVALASKGRHGLLYCVHSVDLEAFLLEYAAANPGVFK